MRFETPAIRRLRDRLLQSAGSAGRGASGAPSGDSLSPDQRVALERIEPLAEALFLTMAADDEHHTTEREVVRRAIDILTDDLLPAPAIDGLLDRLEQTLAAQGPEARLEALASRFALDQSDAETAFALAAAVALSDGVVVEQERSLIDRMRRYFGISAQRATALLEGAQVAR